MLKISDVEKKSVAFEAGMKNGDELLFYNGENEFVDILDYFFLEGEEKFSIRAKRGENILDFEIQKEEYEPIGLSFSSELETRTCQNKCVFCFVDQMPKGLRETLYCKDDDYRLSFISGNYITLTNDKKEDVDRIIRLKLSPIYVSVHATDEKVREKMLNNRFSRTLMSEIKRMTESGIVVHTQIVLCEGLNDKEVLEKSMRELFDLYPMVRSLAVVPVGLTKFRKALPDIKYAGKEFAIDTIARVERFQKQCVEKVSDVFVRCSDEFYCLAECELPSFDSYGDFSQIENGVGLVRKFQDEFYDALKENDVFFSDKKTLLVTGVSFYPFLKKMLDDIKCPHKLIMVKNDFFGESVTVAGLLTGRDIVNAVRDEEFSRLILPKNVLREFGNVFLDDMTLEEMSNTLNAEVVVSENDGAELLKLL